MTPKDDLANLNSLRSLAVLLVLADHLIKTLHYVLGWDWGPISPSQVRIGHVGVITFFVHTSLVLMYSLDRLKRTGGGVSLRFYLRRAFRIYPLSICCVLVAVVLGLPNTTSTVPDPITWPVVASNLLLVQNLWTKTSVIAPLWSLPYEIQMYIVLPVLHTVATMRYGRAWLVLLIGAFSAVGVVLANTVGHLNLAAYVPCFLAGVLSYSMSGRVRPRISSLLWIPFLLVLIATFLVVNLYTPKPIYWADWLFAIIIGLSINMFVQSADRLVNYVCSYVATYSYGVYLWHVPVLYLIFTVMSVRDPAIATAILLPATLAISIVTYHLLEAPMIAVGKRLSETPAPKLIEPIVVRS
jgi:peptidoglycan/LPS O-acetylase OafA/YrhL